jgi:polyvinyl alcohol dehydrogenase (cytochrome)
VFVLAAIATAPAYAQSAAGAEVYEKRCAACHNQVTARIPNREALQKMSSARIMRTLDFGLMMSIAYPLRRDERQAVADYLGTKGGDASPPPSAFCGAGKPPMSGTAGGNWTGWSPTSNNARFQKASVAGLAAAQVPGPHFEMGLWLS